MRTPPGDNKPRISLFGAIPAERWGSEGEKAEEAWGRLDDAGRQRVMDSLGHPTQMSHYRWEDLPLICREHLIAEVRNWVEMS